MPDVKQLGAKGDGQTDDTAAIQRAVNEGDGLVRLPRGKYRITRPIEIALAQAGPVSIAGADGCATVIMDGAGPAFSFIGTHEGTADPKSLTAQVRERERMPMVSGIEIVGAHPQADGIRLEALWQPNIARVHVHDCRHGVHVVRRNRNLIIAECHIYHNRGVGIFYDHLNLHQSNIVGSHISYNKAGGIKVLESEIRNLQISGNDIEYNFDADAEESADVWIETRAASVREGAIVGNTIQAAPSPKGANIRFRGHDADVRQKAGNWAITGNLISSQTVNIHLQYARGMVISGNSFFSGHERTMRIEQSDYIVIGPNVIDRNPDYRVDAGDGVVFDRCVGCSMSGVVLNAANPGGPGAHAAVELLGSTDVNITACQILDPAPRGVFLQDSTRCRVCGCTIVDRRDPKGMLEAIRMEGGGQTMLEGNLLGPGLRTTVACDEGLAALEGNRVVE